MAVVDLAWNKDMSPQPILDATPETIGLPAHRLSEAEFLAWVFAHEKLAVEWVNGEVILMSPASSRQVLILGWLHRVLGVYVEMRELGVLVGPEFLTRLQHPEVTLRVPDAIFVSRQHEDRIKATYLDGPPDLAIEIVSLDSVTRDWEEKLAEYAAAGVGEYWIIDPLQERMEILSRNSHGQFEKMPVGADGVMYSPTVTGFWLKPEWFWQPKLPPSAEHLKALGLFS